MDKEILDILKQLQVGQKQLQDGQSRLEEQVNGLDVGQSRLEEQVNGLDVGQSRLEETVNGLDVGQSRLEAKVDGLVKTVGAIYDQTANLTEFRTEVNIKLEDLKEVKEVTKENCYEIARIKAVK